MKNELHITIKRVYEPPETDDGKRVLVDRLWPRGLSKEHARIDSWFKDIAPSNELRHWFAHEPSRFAEFQQRYEAELRSPLAQERLATLRELATQEPVTLVYAARDTEHNNAVVLQALLRKPPSV